MNPAPNPPIFLSPPISDPIPTPTAPAPNVASAPPPIPLRTPAPAPGPLAKAVPGPPRNDAPVNAPLGILLKILERLLVEDLNISPSLDIPSVNNEESSAIEAVFPPANMDLKLSSNAPV